MSWHIRNTPRGILSVLVVSLAAVNSQARTITVDNDGPADFANIQAAIDYSNDGDTVVVSPGIYTGRGNRDMDYFGKAIVVRSQEGPSLTIIDCEGAGRAFYFHSGEGYDSVLEGFTIKNGSHEENGGAIFALSSSPTVNRCAFVDNFSGWKGGAIHASATHMMLKNCFFWRNEADWGGAVHQSVVYGGPEGAILINCTIVGNYAHNRFGGGGVYCDSVGKVVLANCIVWDNICDGDPILPVEIEQLKLPHPVISYSCVEGWTGSFGGVGNRGDDPLLEATDGFALLPPSPCINAGNPDFVAGPNDVDIDGEKRVMLGRVDMGADEFNPFSARFVVVDKQRMDRTVFRYDCQVVLENISRFTISDISLEMVKWSKNMTVTDSNITFADDEVGPGESITSLDTCTFTVDRSEPINQAEIIWRVTAELAETGAKIEYTASTPPPSEPQTGFDNLKDLAEKWLWQGTAGGIDADSIPDGTVNLADFAKLADQWTGH